MKSKIKAIVVVLLIALAAANTIYILNFDFERETVIEYEAAAPKKIIRGEIYDRNGVLLAENIPMENGDKTGGRRYPENELFAHTVGYLRADDKAGIELTYDKILTEINPSLKSYDKNEDGETIGYGADLCLTLDASLTQYISENCFNSGEKGSVAVINPKSGEVYCMYSHPSYNPNEDAFFKSEQNMEDDSQNPLFPRVTHTLAPPGSTFKTVTALAAFASANDDYETYDGGSVTIEDYTIKNINGGNGNIGLKRALAVSSNVYFSEISQKVGGEALGETVQKLYLQSEIPFDIPTSVSKNPVDFTNLKGVMLAATAFGQGDLKISPFKMALVACAIANDGVLMQPYIVKEASYKDGTVAYEAFEKKLSVVADEKASNFITDGMVECVENGTGSNARLEGIKIAGKTGTAETLVKGDAVLSKDHAWFIGFAPADNPQLAFCIMKENIGAGGGAVCAPVAKDIIKYALSNGLIR